jgi:hypothetical protein
MKQTAKNQERIRKARTATEAVRRAEQVLLEAANVVERPCKKVTISRWYEGVKGKAPSVVGLRISEVDFKGIGDGAIGSYGTCSMQSDVEGLAACAAVERYCLALLVYSEEPDEVADDLWRMLYICFGKANIDKLWVSGVGPTF